LKYITSSICDILGIEYPIIQGAMAWISDASLASAVSNAGGLGIIAAGNAPIEWVEQQIDAANKATDKPFGVNLMMMSPTVGEVVELVIQKRVKAVTTGAGNPSEYIDRLKGGGVKVFPVIPSVSLALRMQKCGADAVIAEGCEAGGHIGETTTMCLIPQVVDAVQIPVVAAGGIADGRGVAAGFILGASGIQAGTVFLAADECNISEVYKEKVLKAKDTDTVVTGRALKRPIRQLKNQLARNLLERESVADMDLEEYELNAAGSLKKAVIDGDSDNGSFMCGQIAGLIKEKQSAKQIIERMFFECDAIFDNIYI